MKFESKSFKSQAIALFSIILVALFNVTFLLFRNNHQWLVYTLGFVTTLILPGFLILYLLSCKKLELKVILLSVPLSLLNLFAIGLACNYIPQMFNVVHPLNSALILFFEDLSIISLIGAIVVRRNRLSPFKIFLPTLGIFDFLLFAVGAIMVLLAVFGTFRLNNGSSDIVTMTCLLLGLFLGTVTVCFSNRLSEPVKLLVIYFIALSLLLIVSLRSSYITGHDVKQEYLVYTITNYLGKWSIGNYRDAYNACLSITILPLELSKLFHVTGYTIFKVCFQSLFAVTPLYIYQISRKYFSSRIAIIGSLLYITYPTFTADSTMINRQEIAFIFFGSLMLVWFSHSEDWLKRHWQALFILVAAGVILSHYSSAYTTVFILLPTYVILKLFAYRKNIHIDKYKLQLSGFAVCFIFLATFFWYAQTTNVAQGLFGVLTSSIKSIPTLFQQDNRDASTNNILIGITVNSSNQLQTYVDQTLLSKNISRQTAYNSILFADDTLPASSITKGINRVTHINLPYIISTSYYSILPRMYQILVILGLFFFAYKYIRNKNVNNLPIELIVLSTCAVIVLGVEVLLPGISLNYGLLRAFQQCMFFLIPVILFSAVSIGKLFSQKRESYFVMLFLLANYLIYTGFAPQLIGGMSGILSLDNSGPYYGEYYTHKADITALLWANTNEPLSSNLTTYSYNSIKYIKPNYKFTLTGILPFQLTAKSSVLLQYEQKVNHLDYIAVDGKLLPIDYNSGFLTSKNLTYTNQGDSYYEQR